MGNLGQEPEAVAIVGMSGRFPGASNVAEFWENLCLGVESITRLGRADLAEAGLDADKLLSDPNYVPARGILKDPEWFDAAFFKMSPKEAEATDPQHRVFLETAWEALETAGCDPERHTGMIGIFAGMSNNTYFLHYLQSCRDLTELVGWLTTMVGNEKDYLATRVAYKLNLRGPAINVYTACSTSLVAVAQACQSLLTFSCDVALAGAVSITFPQQRGYHYQDGSLVSLDGHCRAFDAQGQGTLFGHGAGIVVLKRLSEAVADGDTIYAVLKGAALNNDGGTKASFSAPSAEGQADVIALAQALAGFDPSTISYVEAHGTATQLGDPIEMLGLTQAFRAGTDQKGFCALGSVKTNIGHLDVAAGVAGLIKTALALHHKKIPASLHYSKPNPKIDFAESPFYVNTALREWQGVPLPRRAGVSSFGVGGTNAHVVLEEAPMAAPSSPSRGWQLLLMSAKTASALDLTTANLVRHLRNFPEANLADVAFTLQTGRSAMPFRRMVVCADTAGAAASLEALDSKRVATHRRIVGEPPIVFMFPGQGAQSVDMARGLYGSEPVFRLHVDRCCEVLAPELGLDLRSVLYPEGADSDIEVARTKLTQTRLTQPALFVIGYALAQLWMSWGIRPSAMIGHSIGEYVAACVSGVFAVEDALRLVAARAKLMQELPGGSMLAVRSAEKELLPLLPPSLSLAAVNGPAACVVSGPSSDIEALQQRLKSRGIASRPLATSHAFHSAMMEPLAERLTPIIRRLPRGEPQVPYVSNLTGKWITRVETADPQYWSRHSRSTVRFADGLAEIFRDPANILLEAGPGQILSALARQHPDRAPAQLILTSCAIADDGSDTAAMLDALGRLWLHGALVDWSGFYAEEQRRRVGLPTYPFERKRFFADLPAGTRVDLIPWAAPPEGQVESLVGDGHQGAVEVPLRAVGMGSA